jgi:hypothetical protein
VRRTILIRADDFLEDTRRVEKRRLGGVIVAAVAAGAIVVSRPPPRPAAAPSVQAAIPASTLSTARPKPVVAPASILFPPLTVGSASPAQLFTIRNDADEPLQIRSVVASDAAFLMTNGCGSTLDARTACNIAVVFAPAKPGEQSGSMAVETSDGSYTIPLRGAAQPAPPVELTSRPQPQAAPCPPAIVIPARVEQKAEAPTTIPTYTVGGPRGTNDAAMQVAGAQLRNVWQVSLTGSTDPPAMLQQLGELLEHDGLTVVDRAEVAIRFEGRLDRGGKGRRRRAGEATITRNGRPVLRYVLPSEEYRVGDNPAESFDRVVRQAFNQK